MRAHSRELHRRAGHTGVRRAYPAQGAHVHPFAADDSVSGHRHCQLLIWAEELLQVCARDLGDGGRSGVAASLRLWRAAADLCWRDRPNAMVSVLWASLRWRRWHRLATGHWQAAN